MSSASRYSWSRADGSTGTAWRAKWTSGSRRGFDRKGDALAYAQDREAEARHGLVLDTPTAATTVAQWSATWLAGVRVRPSTETAYRYAVARVVRDLGVRPVGALRQSELKQWRKALEERYAPATASQTAKVLAMMLSAAVEDGLIPKSPMPRQQGGKTVRQLDPDELLTFDQVRAWGAQMPACAAVLPELAAMTGLRQGELLGLRLPHVDFLRREVRVVEQLLSPAGGPVWGPPKTAAGVRTVPLTDDALGLLAGHLAAFPAVDGVLFRSPSGGLWSRSWFRQQWQPAKVRAGLPAWAHWHACRDLFASTLLRDGVDPQSLITVMGHSSLAQVRVYARLMPDSRDNVRASVAAAWTRGLTGVGTGFTL